MPKEQSSDKHQKSDSSKKYKTTFQLADDDEFNTKEKNSTKTKSKSKEEEKRSSKSRKENEESQMKNDREEKAAKSERERKERSSKTDRKSSYDNDKYERYEKEQKIEKSSKSERRNSDSREKESTKSEKKRDKESRKSTKLDDLDDEDRYESEKSKQRQKNKIKSKEYDEQDNEGYDRKSSKKKEKDEYNDYEDDFENDFESDNEQEKKISNRDGKSEKKSSSRNKNYTPESDEEDIRANKSKNKERSSRRKYSDESGDDEGRGRVVKANALVHIPTDSVQVFSSKIFYNHDSLDRQSRRAKDLFKTIELDKKSFNLLDINPIEMRTIYSSHLKHEKVQTNDENFEVTTQTEDIQYSTRWTQYPPDDSKGYGEDNENGDSFDDTNLFEKYRTEVNYVDLQVFLQKASKVIETLINEQPVDLKTKKEMIKSDLAFSKGYMNFKIPIPQLSKSAVLTNCCFCEDDLNYFVCSYDINQSSKKIMSNFSLLIVWNIENPKVPHRILMCESFSTSLCFFSFLVVSGNVDGSITIWDLRESFNLHKLYSKSKETDENYVVRSPTYSTAGVLLNQNHMSEIKKIITLQNNNNMNDKEIFMQLASLEMDCKMIIWTVVELKNIDFAVFETDLGLLPGGKIKLIKSSEISLSNLIRTPFGKIGYLTSSLAHSIEFNNDFFVSTNTGQIIHITRKGQQFAHSLLKSNLNEGLLQVSALEFHHEIDKVLLVGYGNGEIRLYHTDYSVPIKSWLLGCMGIGIKQIEWVKCKSSSFMTIDEAENLYIWDLLIDDTQPVSINQISHLSLVSIPTLRKSSESSKKSGSNVDEQEIPFAFIKSDSLEAEINYFNLKWFKKLEKENKKFSRLIKSYLSTF